MTVPPFPPDTVCNARYSTTVVRPVLFCPLFPASYLTAHKGIGVPIHAIIVVTIFTVKVLYAKLTQQGSGRYSQRGCSQPERLKASGRYSAPTHFPILCPRQSTNTVQVDSAHYTYNYRCSSSNGSEEPKASTLKPTRIPAGDRPVLAAGYSQPERQKASGRYSAPTRFPSLCPRQGTDTMQVHSAHAANNCKCM